MPQDIEKLPLIRSTWWASKVQCYVCISALVSLHVRKPTQMSDIACSVHALWRWHGQYACVYFGLKPSHPSVCSMYVMQWYYYSAASFWVMVLFVHHFSVYSSLWLLIHSFYLPSWNCMLCLKPTCYEDTKFMQISFIWRDFTCLCFHDVVHNVSGLWSLSVSSVNHVETVALYRWSIYRPGGEFKLKHNLIFLLIGPDMILYN